MSAFNLNKSSNSVAKEPIDLSDNVAAILDQTTHCAFLFLRFKNLCLLQGRFQCTPGGKVFEIFEATEIESFDDRKCGHLPTDMHRKS